MRCLPYISAIVLLTCVAMSATCGAQETGLSGDQVPTDNGDLVIHPVNHATFVMQWNGKTVYVDPVGGVKPFTDLPKPDLVLVTHIHGDHFDPATLEAVCPPGERPSSSPPRRSPRRCPRRCEKAW